MPLTVYTADPDFSNPTRRRTERPLETIMSFEAAIDKEYKRQREAAREAQRTSFGQNGMGTSAIQFIHILMATRREWTREQHPRKPPLVILGYANSSPT